MCLEQNDFGETVLKRISEFIRREGRRPRILVARISKERDQRINLIASTFAGFGFDMDICPVSMTPVQIARMAIENDVHVVIISVNGDDHNTPISQLTDTLKYEKADDILIFADGEIPPNTRNCLFEKGITGIFSSKTTLTESVNQILPALEERFQ